MRGTIAGPPAKKIHKGNVSERTKQVERSQGKYKCKVCVPVSIIVKVLWYIGFYFRTLKKLLYRGFFGAGPWQKATLNLIYLAGALMPRRTKANIYED